MHPVLGIAAALALAGPSATAAHTVIHAEASARTVEVVIAAPPAGRARLDERIRELLGALPAQLATRTVDAVDASNIIAEAATGVFAKIWIDGNDTDVARIYIVDAGADRILIRKVRLPAGLDEVAVDEIGLIVEGTVDAMLQGGTIGVARTTAAREFGVTVPTPPTAMPAIVDAPRLRGIAVDVAGGWSVRAWGDRRVQHGPTVHVAAIARLPVMDLGGAIELEAVLPTRVRTPLLELQLAGGSVRALAHIARAVSPRWSWENRLGGGVDIVRDRSRARVPGVNTGAATVRAVGLLAVRSGPAFELGRARDRLVIRIHATLDIEVAGVRWITTEGDPVFVPWRTRPGVAIALGWRRRAQPMPVHVVRQRRKSSVPP